MWPLLEARRLRIADFGFGNADRVLDIVDVFLAEIEIPLCHCPTTPSPPLAGGDKGEGGT